MALTADEVIVSLKARTGEYERGIQRADRVSSRAFNNMGDASLQMERQNALAMRGVSREANNMAGNVARALATVGVLLVGKEVLDYEEAWRNATNTMRQYSDVMGDANQATSDLNSLASDAGVQLGNLSTITGAAARSARDLGRSRADVLLFAESVSKGASLANTGTAAVEGAMIQLSQAIASPRVQLQEFNSVVEGTPRLAQAFADGVLGAGSSIAQLRSAIADGEVSGEQLFAGLLSQADALRAEFETLDQGPRQAINRLNNALTEFLGTSEAVKGGAQSLAAAIEFVADNVDLLANAIIVGGAALSGWLGASAVATVVTGLRSVAVGATATAQAMGVLRAAVAFMGGPWVAGITVAAAALAGLVLHANRSAEATDEVRAETEGLRAAIDAYAAAQREANMASGEGVENARALAEASREEAQASLEAAQAKLADARAAREQARSRAFLQGGRRRRGASAQGAFREFREAEARIEGFETEIAAAQSRLTEIANQESGRRSRQIETERDAHLRALREIESAYRNTFETERQEIERNRQARLDAIDDALAAGVRSEEEAQRLRQQTNDIAERGLQEIVSLEAAAMKEKADLAAQSAMAQAAIEKQKTERAFEALQEQAANEEAILGQMLDARDQAMGDYLAIENRQYEHARELIEREIQDQERKNAALLALAQAHADNVAQIQERLHQDRMREALEEAQTFEEGFRAQWDIMRSEAESAAADIGVLFAETFGPGGSIQEAIGSAAGRAIAFGDDFQDSMEQAARTIASDLIGALVQYGVQLAIQAALGKALGAGTTAFAVGQAAAISAAMAPAAALASLASFGANAAPAQAGILATMGLAQGLAALPGFADGVVDYNGKGTGRSDSNLIRFSNGESVMTADATAANKSYLTAMNNGLNMDEYLKGLTRPIAMSPAIVGGGSSMNSVSIHAPVTISGTISQDTMPDIQRQLNKLRKDISDDVSKQMRREEVMTTPRHLRRKSFK